MLCQCMFDNFSEKCYNQIMGDEFMRADNQAKNKIKNKNLILKKIIMGKSPIRTSFIISVKDRRFFADHSFINITGTHGEL